MDFLPAMIELKAELRYLMAKHAGQMYTRKTVPNFKREFVELMERYELELNVMFVDEIRQRNTLRIVPIDTAAKIIMHFLMAA